ncbi:uncharacterized protein VTP21DRAFT_7922 [Calcarisporiella thermophila]|uniref:uncharacterized protein n=1 Tax=Calcarisporiella thermophila TaxID=911321 RepID=UPI003743D521
MNRVHVRHVSNPVPLTPPRTSDPSMYLRERRSSLSILRDTIAFFYPPSPPSSTASSTASSPRKPAGDDTTSLSSSFDVEYESFPPFEEFDDPAGQEEERNEETWKVEMLQMESFDSISFSAK